MDIVLPENIYFLQYSPMIIGVCQCSAVATVTWQSLVVILGKFPVTGFVDIALPINDDNILAEIANL